MTRFTQYSEGTRKGGFLSCFFNPLSHQHRFVIFFFISKIVSHQTFNKKNPKQGQNSESFDNRNWHEVWRFSFYLWFLLDWKTKTKKLFVRACLFFYKISLVSISCFFTFAKQILAKMFPLTNLNGVLLSLIMLIQLAWSRLYFHPRQVTGYIRAYRAVIGNRQTNSNVVVIRRLRPCRWLSP